MDALPSRGGSAVTLNIIVLLGPSRRDPLWEAEKAGWRCFVMGNHRSAYRRGSRLRTAWQRGFDAAALSDDPATHIL